MSCSQPLSQPAWPWRFQCTRLLPNSAADGVTTAGGSEGHDAPDTSLPGLQESFALQVLAKKKPTVLVLMGNDCNGIDKLISGSAAIVRAFYPATHGARAVSADSVVDLPS